MSGILEMVTGSAVNTTADKICKASFRGLPQGKKFVFSLITASLPFQLINKNNNNNNNK